MILCCTLFLSATIIIFPLFCDNCLALGVSPLFLSPLLSPLFSLSPLLSPLFSLSLLSSLLSPSLDSPLPSLLSLLSPLLSPLSPLSPLPSLSSPVCRSVQDGRGLPTQRNNISGVGKVQPHMSCAAVGRLCGVRPILHCLYSSRLRGHPPHACHPPPLPLPPL